MTDEGPDEPAVPIDPDLDPADRAEPGPAHRRASGRAGRGRASVLAAIALGGALGAPARYEVSRLIPVAPGGFPWATFWTNISGSLVLGFMLVLLIERFPPSRHLRPFLATGFLGAYTTYSTFMVESSLLIKDGHAARAAEYVVVSTVVGLAAVWIGIAGGRRAPVRTGPSPGVRR